MKQFFKKNPLRTILFVIFISNVGLGLTYPIFSPMLFDSKCHFLSLQTSNALRGFYLGLLIALTPLTQFFTSPIWGAISDGKGRKKPLLYSLAIAPFGYLIALLAVVSKSFFLLLLSRVVIGAAAGNIAIIQASIADLSTPQEKAKNFGLYNMALGLGFILGPFLGGTLFSFGCAIPFIFASLLIILNWIVAHLFFQESHHAPIKRKLQWSMGLIQVKKAFHYPEFRTILLCAFVHNFGWSFFFEFIPVYLITIFSFSSLKLGFFYAAFGAYYAISTGWLIRFFVKRLKPEMLFFAGMLLTSLAIFTFSKISTVHLLWFQLFLICFFVSFVMPTAATIISNSASPQVQGEALGIFTSVNTASLAISPIFSGIIIRNNSYLPIFIGGGFIFLSALITLLSFRSRLLN